MIRYASVRSAGLALLLTMNGCGDLLSSRTGGEAPGLKVAEAALQGGSAQIALQVSDGVLRGSPGNVRALEIKADALALLGANDQAAQVYQTLLSKDPDSSRATIGLGRVMLSKQPAAAEALFQQALKRDPRDMTALNNLGIARDLQGHHAEAQTAYRQALAINPDLDSAQANLALSMAMTGQGPAAIQLLKAKATQPGVSAKVKHDYAVVLAMSGNRAEAERVLNQDMTPEDARLVLDNATGTHTAAAPEPTPAPVAGRNWDDVPPDVVQVPEPPSVPVPPGRAAQVVTPAGAALAAASANAAPTDASPIGAALGSAPGGVTRAAVTQSAPPPVVVRPHPVMGQDAAAPSTEPVSPVAANQQSMAAPLPDWLTGSGGGRTEDASPLQQDVVPAAVAVPQGAVLVRPVAPIATPIQPATATTEALADGARITLPEEPPPPPVLPPLPLPSATQTLKVAQMAPPSRPAAVVASSNAGIPTVGTATASARTGTARADAMHMDGARVEAAPADGGRFEPAQETRTETRTEMRATTRPARTTARPAPAGFVAAVPAQERVALETASRGGPRAMVPARDGDPAIGRTTRAIGYNTTPTVQFAATASPEAARSFWQGLVHRYPEVLGGRAPVVIRFEHDGEVFWRVRADGFATVSDAQTLCAQMRDDGQPCFVPHS